MDLTVENIINNYEKVQYKATDGNFYFLHELYPLCIRVSNRPDLFHLDTGGPMADCMFFTAKLAGKELHKEGLDGVFSRLSPELRIEDS